MKAFLLSFSLLFVLSACSNPLASLFNKDLKDAELIEKVDPVTMLDLTEEEKKDVVKEKEADFAEMLEKKAKQADRGHTVITVTYPEQVRAYFTGDTRVVLWAEVANAEDVAEVWVNQYKMFKYHAGDNEFTFIADKEIGSLERGQNDYLIRALDEDGKVLAEEKYTIVSDVKYSKLTHSGAEMWLIAFAIAIMGTFVITNRRYS